jgi:UDP-3-O-[3-hydroxymyristoyl] N-acetylglucosamine deacetylase
MSALGGMQITDAEVEVTAPEMPGLDGSAIEYVKAIQLAGTENLDSHELPDLFTRIFIQEDAIKIAASKGEGHWSYRYITGERWPGEMAFDCRDVVDRYAEDIAPARTFALSEEVPHVLAAGLGKGLREGDVLLLAEQGFANEPRFADEPARHKLLDLIGDLYLSGVPINRLNVSAERSGHRTNVVAAMQLRKSVFGS